MSEQTENILKNWCELVAQDTAMDWEHLPSLGLYMDQVLTLLGGELAVASEDGTNPLTSSMINNYVKGDVVPRPEKKKYNREHLAILYMVCMMKSQLALPQIRQVLHQLGETESVESLYQEFTQLQTTELRAAADKAAAAGDDRRALAQLAMQMAAEANARHLAAMQILRSIEQEDESVKRAEKEAAKTEKKEAKAARKEAKKSAAEREDNA